MGDWQRNKQTCSAAPPPPAGRASPALGEPPAHPHLQHAVAPVLAQLLQQRLPPACRRHLPVCGQGLDHLCRCQLLRPPAKHASNGGAPVCLSGRRKR